MSLAERFYRKWYKVKEGEKLSNEQWKTINMMHACLREYNTVKLPQGAILVEKKMLVEHLRAVKECLNNTDKLMAHPTHRAFANSSGGTDLAKIWGNLNLTLQSILHFQLKVPLKRLNEEITDDLVNISQ